MSAALNRYRKLMDEVRHVRARDGGADLIEACMEKLDAVWLDLTDEERVLVRKEGWRFWPDRYATRVRARTFRDVPVWAPHAHHAPRSER